MLAETQSWKPYVIASALAVSVLTVFIWNRRKKYKRVGKICKLYFFPVKSLKAVEVSKGICTKLGFEVNGLLDRSFMVVNESGTLISQREAPSLAFLTPCVDENYLTITGPNVETLKVEIKKSPSPNDKRIKCCVHGDEVTGLDCGDESALWFESYTNIKGVRLVHFFSVETTRNTVTGNQFRKSLRKKTPAGFQDEGPFHLLSQPSIDDLNSRMENEKISVFNFRPNILIEDCAPYAEDSWKYIKINDEVELERACFTTRCLLTTNDPDTGILSKKEPLVTLRKYRILDINTEWFKRLGSSPCLGITYGAISTGEIKVGDDIFAVIDTPPKMRQKVD